MPAREKVQTEAIAGVTTFFTMAYIVIVNPAILATTGTGMAFSGVLTATVLLALTMTLLMAIYARLPFAVAPGMGINAYFTHSLILGQKIEWPIALGMVFWAGILFLILSILPVREKIAKAIPAELRSASAIGIGLFLTFIGLKNMGIVVIDPVTFVKLGHINEKIVWTMLGLLLSVLLLRRKNSLAFLAGIFFITVAFWWRGWISAPASILSSPDFRSVFFKLDFKRSLDLIYLPAIIGICFTDLFDSISTFVGVSHATGLLDKRGDPLRLKEGLVVDACATLFAGLFGTSSGTAYIESTAGIEVGGRTGWTAFFTAICFIPCFFVAPLVSIVPSQASSPVLILVGALMFRHASAPPRGEWENLLPYFLTIVLIPLTFSITQGILWGFVSHVTLYCLVGRYRDVHPIMYGIGFLSIVLLVIENFR